LHDFTNFAGYMRVLSLYNFTKFGCFISINDKIINNLLRWGRFQPNFRRPIAGKLWTGSKNVLDHLYHHAKFGGNRVTHVGVREQNVMFFTLFFLNNALGRRPLWCVVELLPQDIALTFVGRFRLGLQRFLAEGKPFLAYGTIFKTSLDGPTIGARMAEKKLKI